MAVAEDDPGKFSLTNTKLLLDIGDSSEQVTMGVKNPASPLDSDVVVVTLPLPPVAEVNKPTTPPTPWARLATEMAT